MMNRVRQIVLLLMLMLLLAGAADPQPAAAPPPPPASTAIAAGADVAIIRIEGLIYDFTLDSLRRRVDRALEGGATVIVIELDTPGGVVTSALKIARYLKSDVPVPTIAWIHNEAYSAGILVASACNQIVMSPSSVTGDCAPIVPTMELAPTERAKALSPILEEFRDNARANHYDYAMFHAMCVLGVEVYQIEHEETGQRRLVNQADYRVMVLAEEIPAGAASTTQPDLYGVSIELATDDDRGKWKRVALIHDGKTLLTVNQNRAVDIGLAQSSSIRNENDLRQYLNAASVTPIPQSWSENMAGWLTHPAVRAVLILALILGAYVEFQSPGIGVPGTVAAIALVLLMGAPYLVGLAEIWHILLFFLGFILLMVELLLIPGFGVFGVSGIICMFIGLVLAVVPTRGNGTFNLPPPEMMGLLQQTILFTLLAGLGSLVGFYYIFKYVERIPLFNRLILHNPLPQGVAGPAVSGSEVVGQGVIQVGNLGRAQTPLRPSGRAEIQGQIIDVVTLGGSWVELGATVKVIEVHGNRIVVEPHTDDTR